MIPDLNQLTEEDYKKLYIIEKGIYIELKKEPRDYRKLYMLEKLKYLMLRKIVKKIL